MFMKQFSVPILESSFDFPNLSGVLFQTDIKHSIERSMLTGGISKSTEAAV
jgi:hypothetical protein